MNLTNKTALVTGASSGLGLETARLLLEKGMNVHICGRAESRLEDARATLASSNLTTHVCDVSDWKQVHDLAYNLQRVDVLINNAGIWLEGPLESYSKEQIDNVFAINTLGLIYTTHAFLPAMKEFNSGYIVNVASTAALNGRPCEAVYASSKFAVKGFTEALCQELWHTGVYVAGFFPGGIRTKLFEHASIDKDMTSYIKPEKMAEVIVFMIERDESMILNQMIVNRRGK